MIARRNRRVLGWGALASVLGLGFAGSASSACTSDDSAGPTGATGLDAALGGEGGSGGDGAPAEDARVPDLDGGVDAPRDANHRDANGPGAVDALCSFNWDCQSALRCECDEATGCACKSGARGTGRNGIDPCTSSNTCTSAVCVEGPPDSGSFCSDECATSADCVGKLPLCQTVSFVGRICIRTPPL